MLDEYKTTYVSGSFWNFYGDVTNSEKTLVPVFAQLAIEKDSMIPVRKNIATIKNTMPWQNVILF